jgi:hypothetical protein
VKVKIVGLITLCLHLRIFNHKPEFKTGDNKAILHFCHKIYSLEVGSHK